MYNEVIPPEKLRIYLVIDIYRRSGVTSMKKHKFFKLATVSMLLMALLVGCGAKEDRYDAAISAKKIIMATNAEYAPFEFHKDIDGKDQIVGYDILIAQEIAKDLGVELEVKDMSFSAVVESVATGKADFAMAAMDPTPEREKAMLFSQTYYTAVAGVLVKKDDADKFKTADDLKGLTVGVQTGSTFVDVAQQIPEFNDKEQLMQLDKVGDLVQALESNRAGAVLVELPVAQAYAANNPNVVIAPIELKPASEGYVAGVAKSSPKLQEAINKTIDRLKSEGKLDQFINEANRLVESE